MWFCAVHNSVMSLVDDHHISSHDSNLVSKDEGLRIFSALHIFDSSMVFPASQMH